MRCPVCSNHRCSCAQGDWNRVVRQSFNAAAYWAGQAAPAESGDAVAASPEACAGKETLDTLTPTTLEGEEP